MVAFHDSGPVATLEEMQDKIATFIAKHLDRGYQKYLDEHGSLILVSKDLQTQVIQKHAAQATDQVFDAAEAMTAAGATPANQFNAIVDTLLEAGWHAAAEVHRKGGFVELQE